jgi:hypothetical protein
MREEEEEIKKEKWEEKMEGKGWREVAVEEGGEREENDD